MTDLLREERYILLVGTTEHVLRVQESIWASTAWPARFRIQVPTSSTREGKKIYGATAREALAAAVDYLPSAVQGSERPPFSFHTRN